MKNGHSNRLYERGPSAASKPNRGTVKRAREHLDEHHKETRRPVDRAVQPLPRKEPC